MELGLEQFLVRQLRLVLGDQGGRQATAEGVLHHLIILAGAEQHADRRVLVGLANIPVERFKIEVQLAGIMRSFA